MKTPTESEINALAQIIWDYHLMHHPLRKSDCLFALCSNDPRVAEHSARLYLDGWAPLLVFSGDVGPLTQGLYGCSEAEHFASVAKEMGIPEGDILVEARATNTGENIEFTRELLTERGIDPDTFIVVQKPFMERRSFATFRKCWPEKDIIVSSPPIDYRHYPHAALPRDGILNVMIGDLQRIKEYPKLGFQIPQDIPENVWRAFEQLVAWGYDKHLIGGREQTT